METRWVLFLDDVRHPSDIIPGDMLSRYHSDGAILIWAKDVEMAKWYIESFGVPDFAWFDHDLGGQTTMDLLRWIKDETEYCLTFPPPGFFVHSQNPVGRDNIISFMKSWQKIFYEI